MKLRKPASLLSKMLEPRRNASILDITLEEANRDARENQLVMEGVHKPA